MSQLKWFSGGNERQSAALELFDRLIAEVRDENNNQVLEEFCLSYRKELEEGKAPIPTILSRFNFELSRLLREGKADLTDRSKKDLAAIRKPSNIRYGY